jgi:hypothetical protein
METNNIFSIRRFMLYCRHSLIINKKIIGISLIGFVGTLFLVLLFFQSIDNHFEAWKLKDYIVLFYIYFFGLGLTYTSSSFPAFRTKEKSMHYLMLPISSSEKFAFELITRIILFLIIMPSLYWIVANLEGAIVHSYVPEFVNYKFSLSEAYTKMTRTIITVNGKIQPSQMAPMIQYLFIQGGLFVFIFLFAGASHFSKSPFLKTLFTFSLIVAGYFLLIYLLFKGLNLREYSTVDNTVLNIKGRDKDDFSKFAAIALTVINLTFLTIAWFRLKEKEV